MYFYQEHDNEKMYFMRMENTFFTNSKIKIFWSVVKFYTES